MKFKNISKKKNIVRYESEKEKQQEYDINNKKIFISNLVPQFLSNSNTHLIDDHIGFKKKNNVLLKITLMILMLISFTFLSSLFQSLKFFKIINTIFIFFESSLSKIKSNLVSDLWSKDFLKKRDIANILNIIEVYAKILNILNDTFALYNRFSIFFFVEKIQNFNLIVIKFLLLFLKQNKSLIAETIKDLGKPTKQSLDNIIELFKQILLINKDQNIITKLNKLNIDEIYSMLYKEISIFTWYRILYNLAFYTLIILFIVIFNRIWVKIKQIKIKWKNKLIYIDQSRSLTTVLGVIILFFLFLFQNFIFFLVNFLSKLFWFIFLPLIIQSLWLDNNSYFLETYLKFELLEEIIISVFPSLTKIIIFVLIKLFGFYNVKRWLLQFDAVFFLNSYNVNHQSSIFKSKNMNQKSSMSLEKDNIVLFNRVCLFESKTTTSFKTQINNMFIHQSIYTILKQNKIPEIILSVFLPNRSISILNNYFWSNKNFKLKFFDLKTVLYEDKKFDLCKWKDEIIQKVICLDNYLNIHHIIFSDYFNLEKDILTPFYLQILKKIFVSKNNIYFVKLPLFLDITNIFKSVDTNKQFYKLYRHIRDIDPYEIFLYINLDQLINTFHMSQFHEKLENLKDFFIKKKQINTLWIFTKKRNRSWMFTPKSINIEYSYSVLDYTQIQRENKFDLIILKKLLNSNKKEILNNENFLMLFDQNSSHWVKKLSVSNLIYILNNFKKENRQLIINNYIYQNNFSLKQFLNIDSLKKKYQNNIEDFIYYLDYAEKNTNKLSPIFLFVDSFYHFISCHNNNQKIIMLNLNSHPLLKKYFKNYENLLSVKIYKYGEYHNRFVFVKIKTENITEDHMIKFYNWLFLFYKMFKYEGIYRVYLIIENHQDCNIKTIKNLFESFLKNINPIKLKLKNNYIKAIITQDIRQQIREEETFKNVKIIFSSSFNHIWSLCFYNKKNILSTIIHDIKKLLFQFCCENQIDDNLKVILIDISKNHDKLIFKIIN